MSETKTPEPKKTFATKQYRVVGVGAVCQKVTSTVTPEGEPREMLIPVLAMRGEVVDLPEFEARRLLALGAVKLIDAALTYDEMSDEQLQFEASSRSLEVRGSAVDGSVWREDWINALRVADQAVAGSDASAASS